MFKIPKPGEGTRERKPSKYGEGGRQVGGEARKAQLRLAKLGAKPLSASPKQGASSSAVSIPKVSPIKTTTGPSRGSSSAGLTEAEEDSLFEATNDPGDRDVPDPGDHPVGSNPSAFSKLQALVKRSGNSPNQEAASAAPTPAVISGHELDELFEKKAEVERPTRASEEQREKTAKARAKLPILKLPPRKVIKPIESMTLAELREEAKRRNITVAQLTGEEPMPSKGEASCECPPEGHTPGCPSDKLTRLAGTEKPAETEGEISPKDMPKREDTKEGREGDTQGGGTEGTVSVYVSRDGVDSSNDEKSGRAGSPPGIEEEELPEPTNVVSRALSRRDLQTGYSGSQEDQIANMLSLPGVTCDHCPMAEKCPEYKANHTCAYDEDLKGLSSRDANNVLPFLETVADVQSSRAMRAYMMEQRMTGGILDPNVTRQLEVAAAARERVLKYKLPVMQANSRSISVVQSGGNQEQGPGMISKLLASMTGSPPPPSPGEVLTLNPAPITAVIVEEKTESPVEHLGGGRYQAKGD